MDKDMGWGSDFTTNMTTDLEGIYDGNMAGPSRAMAIQNIGIPIIPVSIVSEAITLIGTLRELSARLNLSPSEQAVCVQPQPQPVQGHQVMNQFEYVEGGGVPIDNNELFEPHTSMWAEPIMIADLSVQLDTNLSLTLAIIDRIINEEISVFKFQTQIAPPPPQKNLDEIQPIAELGVDLILTYQRLLDRLARLANLSLERQRDQAQIHLQITSHQMGALQKRLTNGFERLMRESLIVELQPPPVMKVNTKFKEVKLRWLVGNKLEKDLGGKIAETKMSLPGGGGVAKAEIISEVVARDLTETRPGYVPKKGFKPCGRFAGDLARQETIKQTTDKGLGQERSQLVTFFSYKNLLLKKIDRDMRNVKGHNAPLEPSPTRRGGGGGGGGGPGSAIVIMPTAYSGKITDEKFCVLFTFNYIIGDNRHLVFTLSSPLVVVTHGVQGSHAWATITWDKFFSSQNRLPFDVPDLVPFTQVGAMLSNRFLHFTGKPLNKRQLLVLSSKLISPDAQDRNMISFSQFTKAPLAGIGHLGFWEWFYGALKVVEKHALETWRQGLFYGFIGRFEAESLLEKSESGTFLLRFSDSVLGGISICYVSSVRKVHSITPFTTKHFSFRTLSDTIRDLDSLTNLFSETDDLSVKLTPKSVAFPKSNEQETPQSVNYSILRGLNSPQRSQSAPTTPQHFSAPRMTTPTNTISEGYYTMPISDYVNSYPKMSIPSQYK